MTTKVREKSDSQLLYHRGFAMLMRHQNSNLHLNPSQSIREILSNRRIKTFQQMQESMLWSRVGV
jgi:hypothetical protein